MVDNVRAWLELWGDYGVINQINVALSSGGVESAQLSNPIFFVSLSKKNVFEKISLSKVCAALRCSEKIGRNWRENKMYLNCSNFLLIEGLNPVNLYPLCSLF